MQQCLSLGLLCAVVVQSAQAAISNDGKESQTPDMDSTEHERLRHFIGLRHRPKRTVVYQHLPVVHHGLHMLNHQVKSRAAVGPLRGGPFFVPAVARATHTRKMVNGTAPIAAHIMQNDDKAVMNGDDDKGWDNIKLMRADKCVEMLGEHGNKFEQKGDCITFMDKECKDPPPSGICEEWYELLDMIENGATEEEIDEKMHHVHVGGPSPAAAYPPAPGGLSPFKSMDANAKIPEQGFNGKLVAHDNMVTQTSDWHTEYGPDLKTSYEEICADYPDNSWCRLRGYHKKTTPTTTPPPYSNFEVESAEIVAGIIVAVFIGLAIKAVL